MKKKELPFLDRVAFLLRLSIHLYGGIPLPTEKNADSCSSRTIKVTFVDYSQLNHFTTVLDILLQACMTLSLAI